MIKISDNTGNTAFELYSCTFSRHTFKNNVVTADFCCVECCNSIGSTLWTKINAERPPSVKYNDDLAALGPQKYPNV